MTDREDALIPKAHTQLLTISLPKEKGVPKNLSGLRGFFPDRMAYQHFKSSTAGGRTMELAEEIKRFQVWNLFLNCPTPDPSALFLGPHERFQVQFVSPDPVERFPYVAGLEPQDRCPEFEAWITVLEPMPGFSPFLVVPGGILEALEEDRCCEALVGLHCKSVSPPGVTIAIDLRAQLTRPGRPSPRRRNPTPGGSTL